MSDWFFSIDSPTILPIPFCYMSPSYYYTENAMNNITCNMYNTTNMIIEDTKKLKESFNLSQTCKIVCSANNNNNHSNNNNNNNNNSHNNNFEKSQSNINVNQCMLNDNRMNKQTSTNNIKKTNNNNNNNNNNNDRTRNSQSKFNYFNPLNGPKHTHHMQNKNRCHIAKKSLNRQKNVYQ
jgi:hypothetical protein